MKLYSKISYLIFVIFLIALTSCEPNESYPDSNFDVTDQEGIVQYYNRDGFESFNITYAIPNTIDSQVFGFLDNLPEAFQEVGLEVVFTGQFNESERLPNPPVGGEKFYDFELSEIQRN